MAIGPSNGFMKKLYNPGAMKKKAMATGGLAKATPDGTPKGAKGKLFGKK